MEVPESQKPSLWHLACYFLKLGATGFGGPVALTSAMQSDLIDNRKWFPQETFKTGMALSQLAPGPLAAQLAIYFGWAQSGTLGATAIGFAFILPSFVMVIALAILYVHFGSLPVIQKLFWGIGPAVIAIICLGAKKLAHKNLEKDYALWALAIINTAVVVWTESEILWLFLLSGAAVLIFRAKMSSQLKMFSFLPMFSEGLFGPADGGTLTTIFLFFLKSGAFVFGSGLAIVPFLHGGVVVDHHWLNEKQFLDAVAVAMITPGPVVITVGFIGFLVAGLWGALLAALGTFLPCYLFTVIPAPYFSKLSKNKYIFSFVDGVTAAAVGAIIGAAIVLGRKSLVDIPTILIFVVTLLGIRFIKKIPEPLWIVFAGIVGLLFAN